MLSETVQCILGFGGFGVEGLVFKAQGVGFKVWCLGVWGFGPRGGARGLNSWFRVQGGRGTLRGQNEPRV